jgi:hypothetical protein
VLQSFQRRAEGVAKEFFSVCSLDQQAGTQAQAHSRWNMKK